MRNDFIKYIKKKIDNGGHKMGWIYQSNSIISDNYPHEPVGVIPKVELFTNYKKALFIRYTTDFDCEETQFWYCIKDSDFDINNIKAKRRYEINKGLKNFRTERINPIQYSEEIYRVYCDSLKGYKKGTFKKIPKEIFIQSLIENSEKGKDYVNFFGVFEIETNKMCGYSDVYKRGKYIPISSLKTIPEYERKGVTFSLVHGIIDFFKDDTNFQDFLIKYFDFRKAYCRLHIEYRKPVKYIVKVLFPFRKVIKNIQNNKVRTVYGLLKSEAWSRGLVE